MTVSYWLVLIEWAVVLLLEMLVELSLIGCLWWLAIDPSSSHLLRIFTCACWCLRSQTWQQSSWYSLPKSHLLINQIFNIYSLIFILKHFPFLQMVSVIVLCKICRLHHIVGFDINYPLQNSLIFSIDSFGLSLFWNVV